MHSFDVISSYLRENVAQDLPLSLDIDVDELAVYKLIKHAPGSLIEKEWIEEDIYGPAVLSSYLLRGNSHYLLYISNQEGLDDFFLNSTDILKVSFERSNSNSFLFVRASYSQVVFLSIFFRSLKLEQIMLFMSIGI